VKTSNRSSRAEEIRRVILELDKFRYGMMIDIDKLEESIMRSNLTGYWSKWKNRIDKIVQKRLDNPFFRKYTLIRFGLRVLAASSLIIVNLMFLILLFKVNVDLASVVLNPFFAITLILIIPEGCLVMDHLLGKLNKEKVRFDPAEDRMVREMIDGFISMLLMEIRRNKLDKNNFGMKLLFNDYKNIEIIRKNGIFKKHYFVVPKV